MNSKIIQQYKLQKMKKLMEEELCDCIDIKTKKNIEKAISLKLKKNVLDKNK